MPPDARHARSAPWPDASTDATTDARHDAHDAQLDTQHLDERQRVVGGGIDAPCSRDQWPNAWTDEHPDPTSDAMQRPSLHAVSGPSLDTIPEQIGEPMDAIPDAGVASRDATPGGVNVPVSPEEQRERSLSVSVLRGSAPHAVAEAAPRLYPVFLKLAGLPVVVVGGGTVAAGKLAGLVEAGARITVVAPVINPLIRARATARAAAPITLVERGFTASDLDGARWVVAAATPEVNRAVAAAAEARGLFVNAVDDVAAASAYLGAVVRRGQVELAISTGGLAPALAGLLREALEAVLPDDVTRWIDVAVAARAEWRRAGTPIAERRPLLLRALERLYHRGHLRVGAS